MGFFPVFGARGISLRFKGARAIIGSLTESLLGWLWQLELTRRALWVLARDDKKDVFFISSLGLVNSNFFFFVFVFFVRWIS